MMDVYGELYVFGRLTSVNCVGNTKSGTTKKVHLTSPIASECPQIPPFVCYTF